MPGVATSGTGFFVFLDMEVGEPLLVVITNKHVIKDGGFAHLTMNLRNKDGSPNLTQHHTFRIASFDKLWHLHPDPDVDLCALPVGNLFKHYKEQENVDVFYSAFTEESMPVPEALYNLQTMEDIVMIGYPNGLYDTTNNRPIFRRGITATSVKLDYCGKPKFLIDTAVFPGSSGSPVCLIFNGVYEVFGQRSGVGLMLIGVVHAVHLHTTKGKIIEMPINQIPLETIGSIPNNLGIVIRYDKILDFKEVLRDFNRLLIEQS
jgi:hypothetical protein